MQKRKLPHKINFFMLSFFFEAEEGAGKPPGLEAPPPVRAGQGMVNSSHELKLMGFRLSGFQAALRQVPGDSSLLSLQPRLSGQFLPF